MVGLVIVSHSSDLVRGLRDLLTQMEPDVAVGIAGGTDDGEIGTSLELINAALEEAGADGAIVLYDLGSAEMTADTALEFLDDDDRPRFRLVSAPLVEGALAAAGAAAGGATLDEVAAAARAAGGAPSPVGQPPAPAPDDAPDLEQVATLVIRNAQGLHARPAGQIVRALRPLDATVRIARTDTGHAANAASLLARVGLGAPAGTQIEVRAGGPQAEQALTQVRALVDAGFGEPLADDEPAEEAPASGDGGPVPGAGGLAIGPVTWLHQTEPQVPDDGGGGDAEQERARLADARDAARTQLEQISAASGGIFGAQAEVLDDPDLAEAVNGYLAAGAPAATAWWRAISAHRDRVAELPGELFAARAADIDDVGRRVLHALGVDAGTVRVDPGQIVVADDLTPAQVQALHAGGAAGVLVRGGTPAAHMAIVARNLGLPMVLRAGDGVDGIDEGMTVIIDGDAGGYEVEPSDPRREQLTADLERRQRDREARRRAAQATVHLADGRSIEVAANVASVHEAEMAVANGADGVGLLRTEFLFGERATLPTEDEQVTELGAILAALDGRPVIIRTLDIGGDKPSPALDLDPVRNGFLGVRGLRLSLERPDVFRTQLRAVLRLAADHRVRIMFPFVTAVEEILAARAQLEQARDELRERGQDHGRPEQVGMMIEVPVAALRAGAFFAHLDFASIGTNDLFQYLTAAGRTIEQVGHLTDEARRVFDDLVAGICRDARSAGGWVGVCGEIAGEPETAARLVELGVTELSMAATAIPDVKARLRSVDGSG
ncbi:MAG TPA: phosphoenolpyruvate--protein phosphotransferase [Euzebyales bacterium]|nr:phosphoenolpyruvate--protein phosphotransferase [Euzebyales bacterium]